MTPRLSLRAEAQADIEAAAQSYEDQRLGLGFEYTRVVRAAVATIEREPLRYPGARGEVRRALVRHFPHAVYFIADPTVWQSRADA